MGNEWLKVLDIVFSFMVIVMVIVFAVGLLVTWEISQWLMKMTPDVTNRYLAAACVFSIFVLGMFWVGNKVKEWLDWK